MILAIVLALACTLLAGVTLYVRSRRPAFPPVVELAHTRALPRLGFRIASLTARPAAISEPPIVARPPALPFTVLTGPPPSLQSDEPTAEPQAAEPPADGTANGNRSVYETRTGPYAARVVHGAQITLPDDDERDLPIRFRSDHPNARPIAQAGDHATMLRVAASDGRIHVRDEDDIRFGPPAD